MSWWESHGRRLYEQQKRASRLCAEMQQTGLRLDQTTRAELSTRLLELADIRRRKLAGLVSSRFRVGSGEKEPNVEDLRAVIWQESARPGLDGFALQCPPFTPGKEQLLRTEKGKPSVGQNALLFLLSRPDTPPALKEIIVAYWQTKAPLKQRSTFVESPALLAAIGPDSRVHSHWNSAPSPRGKDSDVGSAATRRFTCSAPNLMNLPAPSDADDQMRAETPNIRAMYVPAPGHVFVKADYASAEVHSMYLNTRDETLGAMLRDTALDIHTATAIRWFKLPADTTRKTCPPRIRRIAKEIRFASGYRAGALKVWTRVARRIPDITLAEVEYLLGLFRATHPGMVAWWDRIHAEAVRLGYSEEILMHFRRVYSAPPEATSTANFPNQALVTSVALSAGVGPNPEGEWGMSLWEQIGDVGGRVVAQVHDEWLFEVPERHAAPAAQMVQEVMEGPWRFTGWDQPYRMPADVKICERWGE